MKKIILLFCFVLGVASLRGQVNLVPNPSFEIHTCPNSIGEINHLANWKVYSNTPDLFSSCAIGTIVSVPNNFIGYQQAHSGNSYIGLWCYFTNTFYREIVGVQLITPLSIGQKYFVKFDANFTISYNGTSSDAAINKLGLKFSNTDYSINQNPPINNTADLISNGFITDTLNWTTVFGSFVADSAYNYLMLGNFFDDLHTPKIVYTGGTPDSNSYYYLDDICVSTDSLFAYNYTVTGIENKTLQDNIRIYPNPTKEIVYIQAPLGKGSIEIKLFNSLGQQLSAITILAEEPVPIDLSEYSDGLLFIEISINNNKYHYKLIKK